MIRNILASRGLSFTDAYRASRRSDSKPPLFPLPHNFHSAVGRPQFFPSLYQLSTLSRLTRYRIVDWLAAFGFSLDEVPRFQTLFPVARTVELDASIYDSANIAAWFEELRAPDFAAPLTPLANWLGLTSRRVPYLSRASSSAAYRFVKIGTQDSFAFPDLLPGSIVRIRLRPKSKGILKATEVRSGLFLVAHSQGIACTRLGQSPSGKIVLCSRQMPYAPVELDQDTEAIVHGKADLELRVLAGTEHPIVPSRLGRFWTPRMLLDKPPRDVGEFVRRARLRCGLAFREASQRTKYIARRLGDTRYYCAPATLSDFEARTLLPRQIHKIISICAVYFISPALFLDLAGVPLETGGHHRIPEGLLSRPSGAYTHSKSSAFFRIAERRFGKVPYFLNKSLTSLLKLPDFSPRDVFWAGGLRASKRSGLEGALFLAVDRRHKVPHPSLSSPVSQQPLYVILQRDGSYLCGSCSLQNGVLILRPCHTRHPRLLRLQNRVEAEVVGKVVAVLRKLD